MKARLISSAVLVASLSGCASMAEGIAEGLAEAAVDAVFAAALSPFDGDNKHSSSAATPGCWLWCFHDRSADHAPTVTQPVVIQPVAYYPVSQPRPIALASNTTTAPAVKPQPRPAHVATPKAPVAREHKPQQVAQAPAAKPSTPKPTKPAATPKPNTKNDKR